MIRRLFLTILACFALLNLSAQSRVDRFMDYNAIIGKEVRLYNASSMAEYQGYYAYKMANGKPSVIKDKSLYLSLEQNDIAVYEVVNYKKNNFLKVRLRGEYIYLILNEKYDYIANIRSMSYWKELNNVYAATYSHLKAGSNILLGDYEVIYKDLLLSNYVAISWLPISAPQTLNDEVLFRFTINGDSEKNYALSYDVIEQYKEDFITAEQFKDAKVEYDASNFKTQNDGADNDIFNYGDIDAHRVFEADINLSYDVKDILEENDINPDLGYDILFSAYSIVSQTTGSSYSKKTSQYVKGYMLGKELKLPIDDVLFRHNGDKDYLVTRGDVGESARKKIAVENDAIYTAQVLKWIDDYAKKLDYKIKATQSYYRNKGILILSQNYSYSNSQFGLKFNFYNCFSKEIKYIDITVCAYNRVGDRQKDDIGKHTTGARCIGPISPNETSTYDFDDLFWDDDDIINKLQVEKVVVTFMDNTTRTYSGKSQVNSLRLENYPPVNTDENSQYKVGKATDFKNLISAINWQWTEAELITHLGYNVKRCKKEEWGDEYSECNYKLDNVTVCGIPIANSNIRVNKRTRKLYRMNLLVLDDATDLTLYPKIEKALTVELGEPTTQNFKEDKRVLVWRYDNCIIEAKYWDLSDVTTKAVEKYIYTISIEPRE